jgi:hypothetical protein
VERTSDDFINEPSRMECVQDDEKRLAMKRWVAEQEFIRSEFAAWFAALELPYELVDAHARLGLTHPDETGRIETFEGDTALRLAARVSYFDAVKRSSIEPAPDRLGSYASNLCRLLNREQLGRTLLLRREGPTGIHWAILLRSAQTLRRALSAAFAALKTRRLTIAGCARFTP